MNMNKVGNKCSYVNCEHSTRKNDENLFRFPLDEIRGRQCIINSGNVELAHLPPADLRNKRLCKCHFYDRDVSAKGNLFRNALPIPYTNVMVSENSNLESAEPESSWSVAQSPKKHQSVHTVATPVLHVMESPTSPNLPPTVKITPSTRNFVKQLINLPTPSSHNKNELKRELFNEKKNNNTPRNIKLKKIINKQSSLFGNKRSTISRLKRKNVSWRKMTLEKIFSTLKFPSKDSKIFTKMQLFHRKGTPWTPKEKKFSQQLFYKRTYKSLRKEHGCGEKMNLRVFKCGKRGYMLQLNYISAPTPETDSFSTKISETIFT